MLSSGSLRNSWHSLMLSPSGLSGLGAISFATGATSLSRRVLSPHIGYPPFKVPRVFGTTALFIHALGQHVSVVTHRFISATELLRRC